ncbi:MAG: F0F1 ATP synthase subunit gamma [Bacteroidaceae bacterium]|nr:F0F1 ATP synthase subunit gamma [Bacteroidaceae bacterium]
MASLKEVKTRIASVNSTRKITSAMKMVASSKLHRAQQAIESMRPYEMRLNKMMETFVHSLEGSVDSPYAQVRELKKVALVLYTSNTSLCGGFNGNAIKAFRKLVEKYSESGVEVVRIYAIGKKGVEVVRKMNFSEANDYSTLLEHPQYDAAAKIAGELMQLYVEGAIDGVNLIYHHFKSAASQVLTEETFLPISFEQKEQTLREGDATYNLDYIVEPSKEEIVRQLIPKALYLKIYTALLDSLASEHAARIIAMQVATDNADELLRELKLTYNKTRQQAITTELLDIVGGSMQ